MSDIMRQLVHQEDDITKLAEEVNREMPKASLDARMREAMKRNGGTMHPRDMREALLQCASCRLEAGGLPSLSHCHTCGIEHVEFSRAGEPTMRIIGVHDVRQRGRVATVRLRSNGPKPGDRLCRTSDGTGWPIRGVEWFALPRQDDPGGRGTIRPGTGEGVGLLLPPGALVREGDLVVIERRMSHG